MAEEVKGLAPTPLPSNGAASEAASTPMAKGGDGGKPDKVKKKKEVSTVSYFSLFR